MFAGRRLGRIALGCMPGALLCTSRTIHCKSSQEQPGYAIPPESITALVDYKPIPSVSVQPRIQEHLLYCHYQPTLSLEDVSCPTLRLAGASFNPCTLNSHGTNGVNLYYTAFVLQSLATREKRMVTGLPEGARMEHLAWSPDGQKLAFSLRTSEVGDDSACRLWIMDVASAKAAPVWPEQRLNSVLGSGISWLPDSMSLIIKRPVGTRANAPAPTTLPSSPSVQQCSAGGSKSAVRTYPNLLTSEQDAEMFRHYATVQLVLLELTSLDGKPHAHECSLGSPAIYYSVDPSPDGTHALTSRLRPDKLSFAVPWSRFGRMIEVRPLVPRLHDGGEATASNKSVVLQATDALESMPIGHDACRPGPRGFGWRADQACMLQYCEALDGGDPKAKVDFRDRVLLLAAPFEGPPAELMRTKTRFQSIRWASDGSALLWERWYHDRRTTISRISCRGDVTSPYMEYDFSDAYEHPGSPLLEPGPHGRNVLRLHKVHTASDARVGDGDGACLIWEGSGASEEGLRPFLDTRRVVDGTKMRRLWRGAAGCYDEPYVVLHSHAAKLAGASAVVGDDAGGGEELLILVTQRQTQSQPPQMLLKAVDEASSASANADAKTDESRLLATLSEPTHPQPGLMGIRKSLITYERSDGVPLSGNLYLPAGYDAEKDGPLPTILWAYPREYKSKKSAGQVRGSPHMFTTVSWGSPLFWLTRGYAVLDGFAMPIIGEGQSHENDSYVEQIQMNARAAVQELQRRGVADHRLAIGGHSYGAFMTANVLARCPELFCAGIARSGAYNRTLTPFGFQSEERSFWEAAETYANMSPFHHADKIKTPLLIVHGEADPNPGTYPMQSERLFAAIKGLGGTARLVLLPNEGHWYRARESILHALAEQDAWLEKHVKHAKPLSQAAREAPTSKL